MRIYLAILFLTCVLTSCSAVLRSPAGKDTPFLEGGMIRSDYGPGELTKLCQQAIDQAKERMDAIAQSHSDARTFDNTVLAFESAAADFLDEIQPLTFMKSVSPKEATNKEGAKCDEVTSEFMVRILGRRDLYNALKDQKPHNPSEARLLRKTLEAFEANGLKLSDDKLAQMTELMAQLSRLQTDFSKNLAQDTTTVDLTPDELTGVSADFLSRLKKSADGKTFTVSSKVTDYNQVMENAISSEARKKMLLAYNNRQAQTNTELLEQAIVLRERIAKLMGFHSWANYQLSHGRMAQNAHNVLKFLNGLKRKLAKKNRQDIAQLLRFKKSLDPLATQVEAWDIPYLSYQLKKKQYALDDDKIREYFPSDAVVQAMFKIYSQLLGVRYEEVTSAISWSPDVKLYKIIDKKDDRLIGYFYTDFIPRLNKYEHFAAFQLINGRKIGAHYNKPISAIVGNFNPPAQAKPSLLNHDEVVTLFHEFGHIMHQTLTRAPYSSLSGSSVDQDFVEAPSQMLENWPWEETILNQLSGHYLNPSEKLPPELLKKMIAVRDYQQGYHYTRQLMLALTDMAYHTATGRVDVTAVYQHLYKELIGVDPIQGGHFPAGFGHLMGGYDAGYYGYLWSLVYATDMYTVFQKEGPLDPVAGDRYRRIILEKGNMEDAQVLLTRFLGRPSNNKAFLKKLGVHQ